MCWPSYDQPWARSALDAYQGDTLVYVGEHWGCCADDSFFELLEQGWEEIAESPAHRTWWGVHCRMTAYHRQGAS
jgi:hypothetical protein